MKKVLTKENVIPKGVVTFVRADGRRRMGENNGTSIFWDDGGEQRIDTKQGFQYLCLLYPYFIQNA